MKRYEVNGDLLASAQSKHDESEMLEVARKLMDAASALVDIAAARLLADGVAIGRLKMWADTSSADRGMLVDDKRACTVSARLAEPVNLDPNALSVPPVTVPDLCFEVELMWHDPFAHLAEVDRSEDAAKLVTMRALAL